MWWGRHGARIAGNIRSNTAMTCRPLSSIGRPTRRIVPKGIRVSNGRQVTMFRAIRSFVSGLTERPVVPVPPVRSAPQRKTTHGNSRSDPKPTTRPCRRRATPETPAFKVQYALRSGVESSLLQGIRRFDLRQSRYMGLARTHLQQLLTATAMNVVRVIAWRREEPLGERRRKLATLPVGLTLLYHASRCSVKG